MDEYTETINQSWFSRFKGAIAGVVFAPIFILIGFLILKTGEIRHAATTTGLKEIIHKIKAPEEVKSGELFWITDSLKGANQLLVDPESGFQIEGLKLYRKGYTFIWTEKKRKKTIRDPFGNEKTITTYHYDKRWVSDFHGLKYNSSKFKYPEGHQNPKIIRRDEIFVPHRTFWIAQYSLDNYLKDALLDFQLVELEENMFPAGRNLQFDRISRAKCPYRDILDMDDKQDPDNKGHIQLSSNGGSSDSKRSGHMKGGSTREKTSSLFSGIGTPEAPELGDTRIEYWRIPSKVYTVVGQRNRYEIKAIKSDSLFIRSELSCGGVSHINGRFGMIFSGSPTLEEMFTQTHKENDIHFMVLRFAGLFFMVVGFVIFGNPLGVLFGWLPFIGAIWENLVFKLMQVIGTLVALCISVFYYLKYNTIFNLTIYDLYFALGVILFLLFCNNLRVGVSVGGEVVYEEDF